MKDTPNLEAAVINLFRRGNVMNISQTQAQLAAFCGGNVRRVVLRLWKERLLKSETDDAGIVRFAWRQLRFTVEGNVIRDGDRRFCTLEPSQGATTEQADDVAQRLCALLNREFTK